MTEAVLWHDPQSSASYRVRIALNMADIPYRMELVDLAAAAQRSPDHLARNPQGRVPVLDIDGLRLTQSLAILDYLDETRHMGLLPDDPAGRARVRALARGLAVDVQPVCNLSVAVRASGSDDAALRDWMKRCIRPGLLAFETMLAELPANQFATGNRPGLADICLIPQLHNARRWGVDYSDCFGIRSVEEACERLLVFRDARPG